MTRATKQKLLGVAFFIWICYTIVFSVIKVPPDSRISRFHLDVVFHFSSYLVMAMLGASLIRWWTVLPVTLIAGGTEITQRFLPYRTADWRDFGTNVLGMAIGLAVWWLVRRRRKRAAGTGSAGAS